MIIDVLSTYRRIERSSYRLENILSKEIPGSKIYVEDTVNTIWHRHVKQHGPKPEAYARYTNALNALEESLCSK